MKKLLFTLAVLASIASPSLACTTFFLEKDGQRVFGRNYDWVTATGMVNTNLRGMLKCSLKMGNAPEVQWISKWGSITFNQYGKEFPTGGMNEKGLVVELMWLSESKFPGPDRRPPLSVLQWIQYQLDNCSTVDEVLATDTAIRIEANGAPQHYLVADRQGHVATIEFLNGKLQAHTGSELPYPILANSTYEASVAAAGKSLAQGKPAHFSDNSIERFSTACQMVKQYEQTPANKALVPYAFDILNAVAQPGFTKWSIVYDITGGAIHVRTSVAREEKLLRFSEFDLSSAAQPLALDMNSLTSGPVRERFSAYSPEVNEKMMRQAFSESESQVRIPEILKQEMLAVAGKVKRSE